MQEFCPYCGGAISSKEANFCVDCGRQLRELSPEDAAMVPPEDQRNIPMLVVEKVFLSEKQGRKRHRSLSHLHRKRTTN